MKTTALKPIIYERTLFKLGDGKFWGMEEMLLTL